MFSVVILLSLHKRWFDLISGQNKYGCSEESRQLWRNDVNIDINRFGNCNGISFSFELIL